MNNTLLGKLFAPIVKWFAIFEMRFQVSTFRQQGLVPLHLRRHQKTVSSI
jgi:hypothetical protein